jgi:hypothetical protein
MKEGRKDTERKARQKEGDTQRTSNVNTQKVRQYAR